MALAEFFDILGFIGFMFLLTIGISLFSIKKIRKQALVIILISSAGLIVDGYNILVNFILR